MFQVIFAYLQVVFEILLTDKNNVLYNDIVIKTPSVPATKGGKVMKKTAVKVIAVMIAVCVLLGAFPIGASAATRYAVTITYNGEYGYARMEQNSLLPGWSGRSGPA